MMTVAQQTDTRLRTIQAMMTDAVPLNAGNVQHACAAILSIVTPAVSGGMFALPDYTTKRPDQSEAIEYAVKLIKRMEDHSGAYCLACDISAHSPEAYDVTVGFGPWSAVVTVWLEDGEVYGEY